MTLLELRLFLPVGCLLAAGTAGGPVLADITPEARALFEEAGVAAEVIAQIDAATDTELAIPEDMLAAAEAEGTVLLGAGDDPTQTAIWMALFNARYPDIAVEATEAVGGARAVTPLMAYEAGNQIQNVVWSFESSITDFEAADALARIDDLPAWSGVPDHMKDPDGTYTGLGQAVWCLGYNTERVDPSELPATWADLVAADSPLAGGRVGAANRAHLWAINLWGHPDYGPERMTTEILPNFIENLKPQLRSEGISGIANLMAVGEFDVALPTPNDLAARMIAEGQPIGWHCPEPVPSYFYLLGMFKDSPVDASSRILINWLLSQEGQMARVVAAGSTPVHNDLQLPGVVAMSDQLSDKEQAIRSIQLLTDELPKVYEVWTPLWQAAGGPG